MTSKLRIVWEGSVPGLDERRLSLDAFGPALRELLIAIRRIATDLERDAWPTHNVQWAGRLSKEASNLDLQIEAVTANSPVTIDVAVVEKAQPVRPLIHDLGDRAVSRFLQDLTREARGSAAHYRVRKYLQSLPEGLSQQRYVHTDAAGQVSEDVELGEVTIPAPRTSPHLIEVVGDLAGLGFEPGKAEVKIRAFTGEIVSFSATPEQVENALGHRGAEIRVLGVVETSRVRLLRIGDAPAMTPAERADYVFGEWSEVLAELAK